MNRYLRSTLGFKTDLAYQGIEEGFTPQTGQRATVGGGALELQPGPQPRQAPARAAAGQLDGPPGGAQPWLRRAMAINPSLKAFVAAGLYDSLNSCAANAAPGVTARAAARRQHDREVLRGRPHDVRRAGDPPPGDERRHRVLPKCHGRDTQVRLASGPRGQGFHQASHWWRS